MAERKRDWMWLRLENAATTRRRRPARRVELRGDPMLRERGAKIAERPMNIERNHVL